MYYIFDCDDKSRSLVGQILYLSLRIVQDPQTVMLRLSKFTFINTIINSILLTVLLYVLLIYFDVYNIFFIF